MSYTMPPTLGRAPRPRTSSELRERVYAGEVFLSAGTGPARKLASQAMDAVAAAFADAGDAPTAQFELGNDAFFDRIKALRREFYLADHWREATCDVIEAAGLDPRRTAFDPIKLRVVMSGGSDNPAARAVYGAHRDTWYSHPSCLMTWWLALHDTPLEETFVFYPDQLERPVPNDSERFNYSDWVKDGPDLRIGWQDIEAGRTAIFPSYQGSVAQAPSREVGFSAQAGDELLFAGAHLHRTIPHRSGRTRFSLDFRVIDLDDVDERRGAPMVDSRCRGSAASDYLPVSR